MDRDEQRNQATVSIFCTYQLLFSRRLFSGPVRNDFVFSRPALSIKKCNGKKHMKRMPQTLCLGHATVKFHQHIANMNVGMEALVWLANVNLAMVRFDFDTCPTHQHPVPPWIQFPGRKKYVFVFFMKLD